MKLFQKLLLAPATLSLIAPFAATANEVTINDFNTAEELAVTNSRVDGLEARLNNFEAGSFTDTTTASFSADFLIGSEDGVAGNEAVTTGYSFGMKLKSSFTGDDTFQVKFDAGNSDDGNLDEFDKHDKGDSLIVDGISYKFPIGDKTTVLVGDSLDANSLYNTACVYSGPSKTLSDCGTSGSDLGKGAGTMAAASYEIGNGFTLGFAYSGDGTTEGLMTKEGLDEYGAQLAYEGDSYGASINYSINETSSTAETTYWGLNGYYQPYSNLPSISVGYETGDLSASTVDTSQWFVGLQWDEIGPGKLGAAIGTKGAISDDATELLMYEAFYSYPVNDGMTVTPLIYVKENASGTDDQTGVMVKTSFKF